MRIRYRIRQFWQAATASPTDEDQAQVKRILPPALLELFNQLNPSEQVHSIQVFRQLFTRGENHPDLLAAALLHDVGKSRHRLHLWERVVIVLGKALFAKGVQRWSAGPPTGWRRPFVIAAKHPSWGADMAAQAGAAPLTVALIARHQELFHAQPANLEEQLLVKLQTCDEDN